MRVEVLKSTEYALPGSTLPMSVGSARLVRSALAALALLLLVSVAANIYFLMTSTLGVTQLVLGLIIEAAVWLTAIALLWTWLETRILHPLRLLEEDIDLMVHGGAPHGGPLPAGHALGRLPAALDALADALARARADTTKAMDTARSRAERRSARLEAILRDLSEAVIVCTHQHRVVLYNDAARQLFAGAGTLGIGRMLTTVVQPAALRAALTELNRRHEGGGESRGIVDCECVLADSLRASLAARMRLVVERDGSSNGYVLVLGAESAGGAAEPAASRSIEILERPAFYDFDLFEKDLDGALLDLPLRDLNMVVFDTETTGLEPSQGDQIVQIAGVRVLNGRLLADDRFDELVNPRMPIPKASTRIHGINDEMVAGKDPVESVLRRFHEFVGGAVLVAHNAAFDMKFLKLREHDAGVRFDQAVLDSLLLSVVLQPNHVTHTLDAIASRFGVESRDRHSALGDSVTTAKVMVRMIDVLEARGIHKLGEALAACDRVHELKRLQERF